MSPNPGSGAQITGQDADFEAFVREEVAKGIAAANLASGVPTTPTTPEPITVNLNGQQFSFNTQAELNNALQNTFGQYNLEMERLKSQPPAAPRGAEVTGKEEAPSFNVETFVGKMTSDPISAFDYVDQFRPEIKTVRATTQKVNEMQQALDVYRFRDSHPEFPRDAAPVMQQIIQQSGLTSDYNGLEAAYALGLTRGLIRPQVPQQNQQEQNQTNQAQYGQGHPYYQPANQPQWNNNPPPPQYAQNPYGASQPQFQNPQYGNQNPNFAPPRPNRSAPVPAEDFSNMAENMTPAQIEAVMARFAN